MKDLRVERYNGTWEDLREQWNDLLSRSTSPSAFLTWEWQYTWWQHFGEGQERWILVVREQDGRLCGLASMKVRTRKGVRFLEWIGYGACVYPDYLDCIAESTCSDAVVKSLARFCLVEIAGEWDVLYLSDMRSGKVFKASEGEASNSLLPPQSVSLTATIFAAAARELRRSTLHRAGEECAFSLLGDDYDGGFLMRRGYKFRMHTRNYRRRLNREHVVAIERCRMPAEISSYFTDLQALHESARHSRGQTSNYQSADYLTFQQDVATRFLHVGNLVLLRMTTDGRPVAVLFGLTHGGICYFYSVGYDPRLSMALNVAIGYLVEALIADGVEVLDWLRGAHEYKRHWSDGATTTAGLVISASHRRGRILYPLLKSYLCWKNRSHRRSIMTEAG